MVNPSICAPCRYDARVLPTFCAWSLIRCRLATRIRKVVGGPSLGRWWLTTLEGGSLIFPFAHPPISTPFFRGVIAGNRNATSAFNPARCSSAPTILPLPNQRGRICAKEKLAYLVGEPRGFALLIGPYTDPHRHCNSRKKKVRSPYRSTPGTGLSDRGCARNATPRTQFATGVLLRGLAKSVFTRTDLLTSLRP